MPPKRVSRPRSAAVAPPPVPMALSQASGPALPQPQGRWRWVAWVLAFLQPAAGLLLALLYWRIEAGPVRRFARICLVLGLLGWLLASGGERFQGGIDGERFIQPY